MPKGVMISHDNYIWTKKSLQEFNSRPKQQYSIVSYLPLSHVASQFADIVGGMLEGIHVYFAEPSALQGTLIQTLQEVRPKMFFSVPRVWQKIYDRMMEIARSNGAIKTKIGNDYDIQQHGQKGQALKVHCNKFERNLQVCNLRQPNRQSSITLRKHLDWINANFSFLELPLLIQQ